ncbi:hypothetical protein [Rhizobium binxianense]
MTRLLRELNTLHGSCRYPRIGLAAKGAGAEEGFGHADETGSRLKKCNGKVPQGQRFKIASLLEWIRCCSLLADGTTNNANTQGCSPEGVP